MAEDLSKSVVSARGESLTGTWPPERLRALAQVLIGLPSRAEVVPIRVLAYRTAEIADAYRVSTSGPKPSLPASTSLRVTSRRGWPAIAG